MDSKKFQELVEESTYNHGSFADLFTCGVCDMKMWADNIHEHLQSHISVCTNYQFNTESKTIIPVFDSHDSCDTLTLQKRKLPMTSPQHKQKICVTSPRSSLYSCLTQTDSQLYDRKADSDIENYMNSDRLTMILDQVQHLDTGPAFFAAKPYPANLQDIQVNTHSDSHNFQKDDSKKNKKVKKDKSVTKTLFIDKNVESDVPALNVGDCVTKIDIPYIVEGEKLGTYHCSVVIDSFTPYKRTLPDRGPGGKSVQKTQSSTVIFSGEENDNDFNENFLDNDDTQFSATALRQYELTNAIDTMYASPNKQKKGKQKKKQKKAAHIEVDISKRVFAKTHQGRYYMVKECKAVVWTEENLAVLIASELKRELYCSLIRTKRLKNEQNLKTYLCAIKVIEHFNICKWAMQDLEKATAKHDIGIEANEEEINQFDSDMIMLQIKKEPVLDVELEQVKTVQDSSKVKDAPQSVDMITDKTRVVDLYQTTTESGLDEVVIAVASIEVEREEVVVTDGVNEGLNSTPRSPRDLKVNRMKQAQVGNSQGKLQMVLQRLAADSSNELKDNEVKSNSPADSATVSEQTNVKSKSTAEQVKELDATDTNLIPATVSVKESAVDKVKVNATVHGPKPQKENEIKQNSTEVKMNGPQQYFINMPSAANIVNYPLNMFTFNPYQVLKRSAADSSKELKDNEVKSNSPTDSATVSEQTNVKSKSTAEQVKELDATDTNLIPASDSVKESAVDKVKVNATVHGPKPQKENEIKQNATELKMNGPQQYFINMPSAANVVNYPLNMFTFNPYQTMATNPFMFLPQPSANFVYQVPVVNAENNKAAEQEKPNKQETKTTKENKTVPRDGIHVETDLSESEPEIEDKEKDIDENNDCEIGLLSNAVRDTLSEQTAEDIVEKEDGTSLAKDNISVHPSMPRITPKLKRKTEVTANKVPQTKVSKSVEKSVRERKENERKDKKVMKNELSVSNHEPKSKYNLRPDRTSQVMLMLKKRTRVKRNTDKSDADFMESYVTKGKVVKNNPDQNANETQNKEKCPDSIPNKEKFLDLTQNKKRCQDSTLNKEKSPDSAESKEMCPDSDVELPCNNQIKTRLGNKQRKLKGSKNLTNSEVEKKTIDEEGKTNIKKDEKKTKKHDNAHGENETSSTVHTDHDYTNTQPSEPETTACSGSGVVSKTPQTTSTQSVAQTTGANNIFIPFNNQLVNIQQPCLPFQPQIINPFQPMMPLLTQPAGFPFYNPNTLIQQNTFPLIPQQNLLTANAPQFVIPSQLPASVSMSSGLPATVPLSSLTQPGIQGNPSGTSVVAGAQEKTGENSKVNYDNGSSFNIPMLEQDSQTAGHALKLPNSHKTRPRTIFENTGLDSIVRCGLCQKAIGNKEEWVLHVTESHSFKEVFDHYLEETGYFVCCGCGHFSSNKSMLKVHAAKCFRAVGSGFTKFDISTYQHQARYQLKYPCPFCKKDFTCKKHVKEHKRTCNSSKKNQVILECHLCAFKTTTEEALTLHQEKKHSEVTYTCDMCSKTFHMKNHLSQHIKLKHNINSMNTRSNKVCEICGKILYNKAAYKTHLKRKHALRHQCVYCGLTMHNGFSNMVHEGNHTGDLRYSCVVCKEVFPSDLAYAHHFRQKHKLVTRYSTRINKILRQVRGLLFPYNCYRCNESFLNETCFYQHMMALHELSEGEANSERLETLAKKKLELYYQQVKFGNVVEVGCQTLRHNYK